MRDHYSMCDVFVLPRPSHPATEVAAPTKFAEYAAMGKPILVTRVGDAPDLVTKYGCGVVVADNSPAELAKGIRQITDLSHEQRSEMGRQARKLAESEFTLDIAKGNLSSCVDQLVFGSV